MPKSILRSIFPNSKDCTKTNNKLIFASVGVLNRLNNTGIVIKISDKKTFEYDLKLTEEEMNNAFEKACKLVKNEQ